MKIYSLESERFIYFITQKPQLLIQQLLIYNPLQQAPNGISLFVTHYKGLLNPLCKSSRYCRFRKISIDLLRILFQKQSYLYEPLCEKKYFILLCEILETTFILYFFENYFPQLSDFISHVLQVYYNKFMIAQTRQFLKVNIGFCSTSLRN